MRSDLFVSATILCRLKQSYFVCFFCTKNALWFLVLLLWQIFSERFLGHWKHSGESQGTKGEPQTTIMHQRDHVPDHVL